MTLSRHLAVSKWRVDLGQGSTLPPAILYSALGCVGSNSSLGEWRGYPRPISELNYTSWILRQSASCYHPDNV